MKLRELLGHLADHQVRFVVIGGVALIARGVQRATEDLDIAYARDRENLKRLADALAPLHPRLRGVPPELPFVLDEASLRSGLNFTLDTDLAARSISSARSRASARSTMSMPRRAISRSRGLGSSCSRSKD